MATTNIFPLLYDDEHANPSVTRHQNAWPNNLSNAQGSPNLIQHYPTSPSLSLRHSTGNCYSPVEYRATGDDSVHIGSDTYYPDCQLTSGTNSSLSRHYSNAHCTHRSSVGGRGMVHGGGSELDDSIHQSPSIAGGCKWEGCKYEGSFHRVADLLRHIRTVHISPGSYTCPVAGCLKSFNRRDNLEAHVQRIHKKTV